MNYQEKEHNRSLENDIWIKLQNGDQDALAYFFKRYYSLLFNYGLKMTRDEELIEDTIQDVFFRLWNKRKRKHDVGSPKAYILRSFRNKVLDRLAAEMKSQSFDSFDLIHEAESVQERIMAEELLLETHRKVDRGMDSLPARQREIIYLKFYKDMDYQEISEVLGINYQSVRNATHSAIKSLRKIFVSTLAVLISSL